MKRFLVLLVLIWISTATLIVTAAKPPFSFWLLAAFMLFVLVSGGMSLYYGTRRGR